MPAVANWRILVAALCGGGAAGLVLAGGVLLSRLLRSCGEEWLMLAFAVVLVVANLIALPVGGWIKRRDHRYNPGHHVALSALLACGLLACTCGFQWYLDASAGDPLRAVLLPVAVGIGVGATVESWRCWRRLVVQFRQLGGEFGPLPAKAPCDPEVVRTQYL